MFVSARRLRSYKRVPVARGRWALDSGGFSELSLFGRWETLPEVYAAEVDRWAIEVGGLDWAALYNKQLDAPWKPTLADDSDTSNFSSYDDSIEESGPQLPPEVQDRFAYWEAQMA
jgi:hypothetical protein